MRKLVIHPLAQFVLVALSAALLSGCGKGVESVVVPDPPVDKQAADLLAQQAARTLLAGPLATARGLVLPAFAGGTATRRSPVRPARVGTVSTDSTDFWYEIHAYDAAGQELPWESADPALLARLTMAWRFTLMAEEVPNSVKWHSEGNYDFTGFASSQSRIILQATDRQQIDLDLHDGAQYSILHLTSADALSGLALEKSGAPAYPVAGRLSSAFDGSWEFDTVEGKDKGAASGSVVVTFDGSRYANVLVSGYWSYKLDLETWTLSDASGPAV